MTERYAALSDEALFADLERVESNSAFATARPAIAGHASVTARAANIGVPNNAVRSLDAVHPVNTRPRAAIGHDAGPISESAAATTRGGNA